MPQVIGAVPLFGGAFRLGLLVSVTVAFGCDGKSRLTPHRRRLRRSPPRSLRILVPRAAARRSRSLARHFRSARR